MANQAKTINGITKREDGNLLTYFFPIAVIQVDTAATTIDIRYLPDLGASDVTLFADITDNEGQPDAESLVDYWANNGFFTEPASAGTLPAGAATEAKQDIGNTSLASIDGKTPADPATVTKQDEIIAAINSGSGGGGLIEFPKAYTDIAGALHTESITTQIDLKHTNDKLPLFFDEELASGATSTFDAAEAAIDLAVPATSGAYAIRQTKQRFNYLTGKTKQLLLTCTQMGVQAGTEKRMGAFSGGTSAPFSTFDGVYLEMDGSTHNVCIAKAGIVTKVARAAWDDPLDGTGPSGLNVDFNNFLIIRIQFLWLGGGPVRFQIEADDNLYEFHSFKNGPSISAIYMTSPNLPIRYELRSTGSAGAFSQICSTAGSYGGNDRLGVDRGLLSFKAVSLSSAGTKYMVYASRLKSTHLASVVSILSFGAFTSSKDDFLYYVLLNPTISGTPSYTGISGGALDVATGTGSETITADGTILQAGIGAQQIPLSEQQTNAIKLGSNIDGTADIIAFVVEPVTPSATVYAAFNWLENN